jgi:hypothetical protein
MATNRRVCTEVKINVPGSGPILFEGAGDARHVPDRARARRRGFDVRPSKVSPDSGQLRNEALSRAVGLWAGRRRLVAKVSPKQTLDIASAAADRDPTTNPMPSAPSHSASRRPYRARERELRSDGFGTKLATLNTLP